MTSLLLRGPGSLRIHVRNKITGLTLCGRDTPRAATNAYTLSAASCGVCQVGVIRASSALQELVDVLGQDIVLHLLKEVGVDGFEDPPENPAL